MSNHSDYFRTNANFFSTCWCASKKKKKQDHFIPLQSLQKLATNAVSPCFVPEEKNPLKVPKYKISCLEQRCHFQILKYVSIDSAVCLIDMASSR